MNNHRLVEIISNPATASKKEAEEIAELIEIYPFSSVLRILDAKLSKIQKDAAVNNKITTAAIFTTDRSILKKYIEDEKLLFPANVAEKEKIENKPTPKKEQKSAPVPPAIIQKKAPSAENTKKEPETFIPIAAKLLSVNELDKLTSELSFNIAEYKKNKIALDAALLEDEKKNAVAESKIKKATSSAKRRKKVLDEDPKPIKKESLKVKKTSLKGDKNIKSTKAVSNKSVKKKPVKKEKADAGSLNISKTEDKEILNPVPKKKLKKEEQVELIENFIKTEPQITKVQSAKRAANKEDLSIESSQFNDSIITENLACIMVKQGKIDKAIDIYKRLIWKFPQKKTYFAAQIEELKK